MFILISELRFFYKKFICPKNVNLKKVFIKILFLPLLLRIKCLDIRGFGLIYFYTPKRQNLLDFTKLISSPKYFRLWESIT